MYAHVSMVALNIAMFVSILSSATCAQDHVTKRDQGEEQVRQAKIDAQNATAHLYRQEVARSRRLFDANAVSEQQLRQAELNLAKGLLQLAIIKNDAAAMIEQLEAIVAVNEAELRRVKTLHENGSVAEEQLRKARSELDVAKAQLAAASVKGFGLKDAEATDDPKLKALLKRHRDILQERFNLIQARCRSGQLPIDAVIRASCDLSIAELELAESPTQRSSHCEKLHERMKQLEQIVEERFKSGQASREDVLNTTAARLKAEIRMHRERNAATSRPK